jgi:Ca-activated chloride channel family protein
MIRWDAPGFLLLLLLLPALAAWRWRRPGASLLWGRVSPEWPGGGAWLVRALGALPLVCLGIAVVALARPQAGQRLTEVETKGVDIMLAIDISPSMQAEDFQPLNRLHVAKETAREFIQHRKHDRLGLVAFAATAFTQCPLTLDHDVLLQLLSQIDFGMAEDGTAIGMALGTAVARLRESKTPSKVIVLITDGQSNRGAIDPQTGAELARALGIKVYAVLVGRGGVVPVPVNDPLFGRRVQMVRMDVDEQSMQWIAQHTGGRFFRARDPNALSAIYSQIDRLERAPIKSLEFREYRDLGPSLLALGAGLLALYGLLQATWAFRLP